MSSILAKLNRRFLLENEESGSGDWKDPLNQHYDRQVAEDALYHTIGPMTDSPRWADSWTSRSEPVPGFEPGGKAPQWTEDEVVMAMAGDTSQGGIWGLGTGHPRSARYGRGGGSPVFRAARKVARKFGRSDDREFVEDLYQNGVTRLSLMSKPGYDQGRGGFISYTIPSITSAMEHDIGKTKQDEMGIGDESRLYTDPSGFMINRLPKRPEDAEAEKGWTKKQKDDAKKAWERKLLRSGGYQQHSYLGIDKILKMNNPEEVRAEAEKVTGRYKQERSHDKIPGNPFGVHSPAYYELVNQYANALESGDEEKINAARNDLSDLGQEMRDVPVVRGASTGLGQAVTDKSRSSGNQKDIMDTLIGMPVGETNYVTIAGMQRGEEYVPTDEIAVKKVSETEVEIRGERMNLKQAAYRLDKKGLNIKSLDVPSDETGKSAAGELEGTNVSGKSILNPEATNILTKLAMEINFTELIRSSPYVRELAVKLGGELEKNGEDIKKVRGPLTGEQLRVLIRRLGPAGKNYYGKDNVRSNVDIPRNTGNWWQPGEDPEIEPLPNGGLWHSIWKRGGWKEGGTGPTAEANIAPYSRMEPNQMAREVTQETGEFIELGINGSPARMKKYMELKEAGSNKDIVSAQNFNIQRTGAWLKFIILSEIEKGNLGMDELDESTKKIMKTINEEYDTVDRQILIETCDTIVKLLSEESPPGWKGTVKAMKKHDDIDNPYALAWSMHKKGAKPNYKDKDGEPEKKVEESMKPVDSVIIE